MLQSQDFRHFQRLQAAANNKPPMCLHEKGDAVQALQRALMDLGYPLPHSSVLGVADGCYSHDTYNAVRCFQLDHQLACDGIAECLTLHALDRAIDEKWGETSMSDLLTRESVVKCSHGGSVVMPAPRFGPFLTADDFYAVAGCGFQTPCRKVKWIISNPGFRYAGRNTLNYSSVGVCVSAFGVPTGPVVIMA
ncbi:MAG: peptidoglycan-binding protein [Bryobacterales bacterium]|nr:peptidoglycan-binding protein [Bryobacterales bacterium]